MKTILFDATLTTYKGKRVHYYDEQDTKSAEDKELRWFHIGYGTMSLYRLHQVDADNFIAEPLDRYCRAGEEHLQDLEGL